MIPAISLSFGSTEGVARASARARRKVYRHDFGAHGVTLRAAESKQDCGRCVQQASSG